MNNNLKVAVQKELDNISYELYHKTMSDLTQNEVFDVLMNFTKNTIYKRKQIHSTRKLYYISAEFLVGKLLVNNLINLGLYDEINQILSEIKIDISELETFENEPSLGNGGLGRLAACFVDSISTLGFNGSGVGINYHFGLFKQQFNENKQWEIPDKWLDKTNFLCKTDTVFFVKFSNLSVKARLYQMPIIGYDAGYNNLNLFDIDTVDETIVNNGINFNKKDINKNLSLFLYPDDSDDDGRKLRIYQEYFLVSTSAQLILQELEEQGHSLLDFPKYVVIQINDTHPAMIIPELIRLLIARGIDFNMATELVTKTVAYTNHTILSEALEKWELKFLQEVVPNLVPIIQQLDDMIKNKYHDRSVHIISQDQFIHMAHMAIHFSFSVNGVAELHTQILQNEELKPFYDLYPYKFNNKTNGITFRRWLIACNPPLNHMIKELIGEKFMYNATELEKLVGFANNPRIIHKIQSIKQYHKKNLANYILQHENIPIDESSIFDIQIKRIHEYKRQQLNALYVIYQYLEIKKGNYPPHPITCIFGGKAAPAYIMAKDIIHLILSLQELINNDKTVNKHIKVVMVENYNVSYAQKLIPACDISEQISLASKEASGTGNMKLMLNGAITLGTLDGANIEIRDAVGDENIYIFGKNSKYVIERYAMADYESKYYYDNDDILKNVVDFIISDTMSEVGDIICLTRLYNEFLTKDWFMTFLDFKDYIRVKNKMIQDYHNRESWGKKMIINIAKSGYFSSDRTINEYNSDIWHITEGD